jgi:hypothetical protein
MDEKRLLGKEEMLEMRLDGMTYQEISNEAGISRQRVQQLLSPPPKIKSLIYKKFDGRCNRCGIIVGQSGHIHHNGEMIETYNDIDNLELLCISCHRKAHGAPFNFQCLNCGKDIRHGIFCSWDCYTEYRKKHMRSTLVCSYCGQTFNIMNSQAKNRARRNSSGEIFCSHKCLGHWNGKLYGFGSKDKRPR